jgi:putative flippase GtrA
LLTALKEKADVIQAAALAFFGKKSYNIPVISCRDRPRGVFSPGSRASYICQGLFPKEAAKVRTLFEKYRELILYVVFGGLTTLVDWVSYWLMTDGMHVPYMTAAFLSQLMSIVFAYVTNRRFVFESRVRGAGAVALEMAKFFGARGASLLLNMLVMFVGVDLLHVNDKLIKVIASVLVIIANYIFSKLFVFRGPGHEGGGEDPNGKEKK